MGRMAIKRLSGFPSYGDVGNRTRVHGKINFIFTSVDVTRHGITDDIFARMSNRYEILPMLDAFVLPR